MTKQAKVYNVEKTVYSKFVLVKVDRCMQKKSKKETRPCYNIYKNKQKMD